MRVDGKWFLGEDGVIRPTVPGFVRIADGRWSEVTFLLDAGADRTGFSARFLHKLRPLEKAELESARLTGVGGETNSITIECAISFERHVGQRVTVRGQFGVFTDIKSADLSLLGRDVTDNFAVIYDRLTETVALLAPPHFYEIRTAR